MQKKGWNPHFELVTFITREELERRLKNVTILRSKKNFFLNLHILLNLEDYLFVAGKVTDKEFDFRINSNRIPPRCASNPFLPKVCGEIIENIQGESIVRFQLKKGGEWIIYYLLYLRMCFYYLTEPYYFTICLFFGCLISVLLRMYWKFVGRRVKEWLEELFETKEDRQTLAKNKSWNE